MEPAKEEIKNSKARSDVAYKLLKENITDETMKLKDFFDSFQGQLIALNQSIKSAESAYKADALRFSPYTVKSI